MSKIFNITKDSFCGTLKMGDIIAALNILECIQQAAWDNFKYYIPDEALEEDSTPYWGDTITDKDIPGYLKVATRLASNIGPVRGKTIKKFSTPMGNLKVVATSETLKDKVTPGKPEIKNNGMILTNLINTPEMHAEVVLLNPIDSFTLL